MLCLTFFCRKMQYDNVEWTVEYLVSLVDKKLIDLNPTYQRNDIWSLPAKKRLIDSVKLGYPLPAFFLHDREDGSYDMVDGQQRTRTLGGYIKNIFPDLQKRYFNQSDQRKILDYRLSVTLVKTEGQEAIEDLYYRMNNFGAKLNRQEKIKAQYHDTLFHKLVEELAETKEFSSLNLFSESAESRMIDVEFVSELIAQLKYGITDKKKAADRLYVVIETHEEANKLRVQFMDILTRLQHLNNIHEITKTRYKQKNDLYTLFGFLKQVTELQTETIEIFYKSLVAIGPDILPSNEDSVAMQEYAFNCISQSNSSDARKARLEFFDELLLNESEAPTETQEDVIAFYGLSEDSALMGAEGYTTLNPVALTSANG